MKLYNHNTKEFTVVAEGGSVKQLHCVTPFFGDACPDCGAKGLLAEVQAAVAGLVAAKPEPVIVYDEIKSDHIASSVIEHAELTVSAEEAYVEADAPVVEETPKPKAKAKK